MTADRISCSPEAPESGCTWISNPAAASSSRPRVSASWTAFSLKGSLTV